MFEEMFFMFNWDKLHSEKRFNGLYLKQKLHEIMLDNGYMMQEGTNGVYVLDPALDYDIAFIHIVAEMERIPGMLRNLKAWVCKHPEDGEIEDLLEMYAEEARPVHPKKIEELEELKKELKKAGRI